MKQEKKIELSIIKIIVIQLFKLLQCHMGSKRLTKPSTKEWLGRMSTCAIRNQWIDLISYPTNPDFWQGYRSITNLHTSKQNSIMIYCFIWQFYVYFSCLLNSVVFQHSTDTIKCTKLPKGQFISKGLFGILIPQSSQKTNKKDRLYYYNNSGRLVFVLY